MVSAFSRPVFEFETSLLLAEKLYSFGDKLLADLNNLKISRDAALDAWTGPWGDEYRKRATEENINIFTTVSKLNSDADRWAEAWQNSATEMNYVVYAETVVEVDNIVKEREKGGFGRGVANALSGGGAAFDLGGKVYDWATQDSGEAFGKVPEANEAGKPRPNLYSGLSDFVHYSIGDNSVSASYHDAPPGLSDYSTSVEEIQAVMESSGGGGGSPPADPNAEDAAEGAVTVSNSRPSEGSGDGRCSMDLDLVDAYLEDAEAKITALANEFDGLPEYAQGVIEGCQFDLCYTDSIAVVGALFEALGLNLRGLGSIRASVGQDHSGVVELDNSFITEILEHEDVNAAEAPGLIKPNDRSFISMPTSGFFDDPVCAANGNFLYEEVDLPMPGFADAIACRRSYNSLNPDVGVFGLGWSSVLDMTLLPPASVNDGVLITLSAGAQIGFGSDGEGGFVDNIQRRLRLSRSDDGWCLREGFDTEWLFDPDGELIGGRDGVARWRVGRSGDQITVVEELSGRSLTYSLSSTGQVHQVETSDGRIATFTYGEASETSENIQLAGKDGAPCCIAVDRPVGDVVYEVDGGLVVEISDADGVIACRNTYDEWGRTMSQVSPFGLISEYDYKGDTGATAVSYDGGRISNLMVHDKLGNLKSMFGGDGTAMTMRWDEQSRMVELKDRVGNTTNYSYHADLDVMVGRKFPDGTEEHRSFDDYGRLIETTQSDGSVYKFGYVDDQRSPSVVIDPVGGVTRLERDRRELPVKVIDPDGITTLLTWNNDGLLASLIDPSGTTNTFTYSAAGELVKVLDRSGAESMFDVDDGGRLTRLVNPAGEVQEFSYSPGGRPLRCVANGEQLWAATYGDHGVVDSITDPHGVISRFSYDLCGDQTEIVTADGTVTELGYSDLGDLQSVTVNNVVRARQEFDKNQNLVAIVDGDGFRCTRTVDEFGRTSSVSNAAGDTTRFTYHPGGQPESVVAPDGSTHRYEVDSIGRLVAAVGPDGGATVFEYSVGGRLVRRTSPAGRTVDYRYDEGHLVSATDSDGTIRKVESGSASAVLTEGDAQVSFSVDDSGRVASWSNTATGESIEASWEDNTATISHGDSSSARFEIDRRGLVNRVIDPAGIATSLEHDVRGQLISATTGDETVEFSYNAVGAMTSANSSVSQLTLEYSPGGRLQSTAVGDSPAVNCGYDAAGRVAEVTVDGDSEPVLKLEFDVNGRVEMTTSEAGCSTLTYDSYGSVTSRLDTNGTAVAYGRDADGLITSMSSDDYAVDVLRSAAGAVTGFGVGGDEISLPEYGSSEADQAGRITIDAEGRAFCYDDAGRLLESTSATGASYRFGFGDNGWLENDSTPQYGDRSFRYDSGGRLQAITSAEGVTKFSYDDGGRRVNEERSDGSSVAYAWNGLDQLRSITETAASGQTRVRSLSYSGDGHVELVDETSVVWDAVLTHKPIQVGDRQYVRSGMATREVGSEAGWFDGEFDDPWGDNSLEGVCLGYRGELQVDGLVFMGARVYDPSTRSFLTCDPLAAVLGHNAATNPYQYAYNDPTNYVDPTGLRPIGRGAEFDEWRANQETSRWDSFVQNAKDDPLGTAVLVAVVIVAVALIVAATVFSGGTIWLVIGAGALVGAAAVTAMGFATKSFNPRSAAVAGVVGGLAAGAAWLALPVAVTSGGAAATFGNLVWAGAVSGAVSGFGQEVGDQLFVEGTPLGDLDIREVAKETVIGTAIGTISGGVTAKLPGLGTGAGPVRQAIGNTAEDAVGGFTEGVTEGIIRGDLNATDIAVNTAVEAVGGNIAPSPASTRHPRPDVPGSAGPGPDAGGPRVTGIDPDTGQRVEVGDGVDVDVDAGSGVGDGDVSNPGSDSGNSSENPSPPDGGGDRQPVEPVSSDDAGQGRQSGSDGQDPSQPGGGEQSSSGSTIPSDSGQVGEGNGGGQTEQSPVPPPDGDILPDQGLDSAAVTEPVDPNKPNGNDNSEVKVPALVGANEANSTSAPIPESSSVDGDIGTGGNDVQGPTGNEPDQPNDPGEEVTAEPGDREHGPEDTAPQENSLESDEEQVGRSRVDGQASDRPIDNELDSVDRPGGEVSPDDGIGPTHVDSADDGSGNQLDEVDNPDGTVDEAPVDSDPIDIDSEPGSQTDQTGIENESLDQVDPTGKPESIHDDVVGTEASDYPAERTRGLLGEDHDASNKGAETLEVDGVQVDGNGDSVSAHGHLDPNTDPQSFQVPEGQVVVAPADGATIADRTGNVMEVADPDELIGNLDRRNEARADLRAAEESGDVGRINRAEDALANAEAELENQVSETLVEVGEPEPFLVDAVMQEIEGVQVYRPGDDVPNYTVSPPDDLKVAKTSSVVDQSTTLKDLLDNPDIESDVVVCAFCTEHGGD